MPIVFNWRLYALLFVSVSHPIYNDDDDGDHERREMMQSEQCTLHGAKH